MQIGIIGLGRMGASLGCHAVEQGHSVVGFDSSPKPNDMAAAGGVQLAASVEDLIAALAPPRVVLIYVPHGDPTEQVCQDLLRLLAPGDLAVDGGNSHWLDAQRRHALFGTRDIRFLDMGTSGGVTGARHGACFMVGGEHEAFDTIAPLLRGLAVDDQGVIFAGAPGAGHFVKLIHNAIEFGMVQSIAEGTELLKRSEFELDLPALFENWMHGSVIRSWLVELMGKALRETPDYDALSTYDEDTGEVKWVIDWAFDQDIPAPAITTSQMALMQYRDRTSTTAKSVALLRHQYGGHPVHLKDEANG